MKSKFTSSVIAVMIFSLLMAAPAAGKDEVRLGIAGFSVENIPGIRNLANFDTMFIKNLQDLEGVVILERKDLINKIGTETKLQQSGLIDEATAVAVGRVAGVNYMLLGTLTPSDKMSATRKEEVDTYKDKWGNVRRTVTRKVNESHEISVVITARIVDVQTSQVVWSGSENSDTVNEYKSYDSSSYYNGISNTLVASIVTQLAEEAAYFLSYKLRQEFAGNYTYVIEQNGNDFIIDAGTSHGVANGMVFLVYAEGREIKDRSGKVLGTEPIIIAALKVKNVQGSYSVCSVAKPSVASTIRVGDRVEPIRFKRSSKLQYPKKRPEMPKPKSSLFDEVMQTVDSGSTNAAAQPQGKASASMPPSIASARSGRPLENDSTDPTKVIPTYGLPPGEANTRRIAHLGARKLNGKKAYEKYVELATSYDGDYLAAYQAGEAALKLKQNDDAKAWYDKALAINPDYKPARNAREKMK